MHVLPGCCSASMRASCCSLERKVLVVPVDFRGRNNCMGAGKLDKGTEGHRDGWRESCSGCWRPTKAWPVATWCLGFSHNPAHCSLLPVAGSAPGLTTCISVPGLTLLCCLQRGCRKLYVLIQTKAGKILLMSFLGSWPPCSKTPWTACPGVCRVDFFVSSAASLVLRQGKGNQMSSLLLCCSVSWFSS